jgi:hypothetical protein
MALDRPADRGSIQGVAFRQPMRRDQQLDHGLAHLDLDNDLASVGASPISALPIAGCARAGAESAPFAKQGAGGASLKPAPDTGSVSVPAATCSMIVGG